MERKQHVVVHICNYEEYLAHMFLLFVLKIMQTFILLPWWIVIFRAQLIGKLILLFFIQSLTKDIGQNECLLTCYLQQKYVNMVDQSPQESEMKWMKTVVEE